MRIAGIEKFSLIDYPKKISCIIFLSGCNFRCPFCYSKELVLLEEIKNHIQITKKEVFDFLKERKEMLEGVVICGGEPTINNDLPDFIKDIKKMGFLVKLDTNGSNPEMLKKLIKEKLIDYVAMDIKAPIYVKRNESIISNYEIATGVKVNLEKIKESVDVLKRGLIDFEFRTTVVPTIHKKEDILSISKWIGGKNVKYYLQNFRAEKTIDKKFEKIKSFNEDFLKEIIKEISSYFKECKLR